jgi:O-acetyl-ADP-ribose deacetylase (regulator of RNase III)
LIEYIDKDITTVTNGIVAHGVNCQHAMNSGVARAIRNKWPIVYERYMRFPKGEKVLGKVDYIQVSDNIVVANCYTQLYYGRSKKTYADVISVKSTLTDSIRAADTINKDLYIPYIGCGLGGLIWDSDVEPIVKDLSEQYTPTIWVCKY